MKTYLSVFRIRLINGLQYRAVALGAIFSRFFWAFFEILAFSAVYAAGDADFSMTFPQTAAYMWMQQALYTVFSVVYGDADIYDSIRSGGIAYELVRPADLYARWLFSAAGNRVAPLCTGFLPMLLITLLLPEPYRLLLPGSAAQLLLFLISAVLGLFVTVSISTLMHISMFFTLSHRGTRVIFTAVTSLLSGGLIPLAFFPDAVRGVVQWLPFAAMRDIPLRIYCGTLSGAALWVGLLAQVFWLAALVALGKLCMRVSLKRVVVQGG